jgi:hypothetical protein
MNYKVKVSNKQESKILIVKFEILNNNITKIIGVPTDYFEFLELVNY